MKSLNNFLFIKLNFFFIFISNIFEKYINTFIIIIFIILCFFNKITIYRLFYFILIFVIIILYNFIINFINKIIINYINNKDNKDKLKKFILTYVNVYYYDYIILILFKLNLYINPILYIIPLIELQIFNVIKQINYWISNKLIRNLLILIVLNITSPFKIILSKFYKMLYNFQNLSLYELLFRRMYGVIFSVLIFSNIINVLITYCDGRLMLLIYIYIFLLILSIINCVNIKIMYFQTFKIDLNAIINRIITNKNLLLVWKMREKVSILKHLIILWFNLNDSVTLYNTKNNKENNFINLIKIVNIEFVDSYRLFTRVNCSSFENLFIINFQNWYNLEKLYMLNNNIYYYDGFLNITKFIKKNKMLYSFYSQLIIFLHGHISDIAEIFYIKYHNEKYCKEEYEFILKVYSLILKILIYMVAYIEESLGIPNFILNKLIMDNSFYIDFERIEEISIDEFENKVNMDNSFFDLDKNWEFYNLIYFIGNLDDINYKNFQDSFKFIKIFNLKVIFEDTQMLRYGCSTPIIEEQISQDLLKFKASLFKEYSTTKNKEVLIKTLLNDLLNV